MQTIKDRMTAFLLHLGVGQAKFAEICGLSRGFANNVGDSIRSNNADKIAKAYPQLNLDWLLYGKGEMLKSDLIETNDKPATGKLIPFYDAEVAAGADYVMNMDPARQTGVIEIGSILYDSESAVRVYGNSMVPNYPAGCVIGVKRHTDSFIEPGRVYVVETGDNRYLKRLYYNDERTSFHCLSDNQMKYEEGPREGKPYYQDFEIPLDEVIRVHRVVGVIKRNIM